MKRIISFGIVIMMILSALALAACSGGGSSSGGTEDLSDSKYVGTWTSVSVNIGEESGALEDVTLTINGDGTGVMSSTDKETGKKEDTGFNWEPVDGGFKTTGDVKLTFKDNGDKIEAKLFGVGLLFEKQ